MTPLNFRALRERPYRYFLLRNKTAFYGGLFCLLITDALDMLHPMILKTIIDNTVDGKDILQPLGMFIGLMVFVAIFRWAWRLLFGRLQHRVADELRTGLFQHLVRLSPSYHQTHPVGGTMSVLSQDVNAFRMGVGPGVLILMDGVFLLGSVIPLMIYISWDWTWKSLILVPLVPFIIQRVERIIQERFRKQQDDFSELSGVVQEIVSGMRVIKSFSRSSAMAKYFEGFSEKYLRSCNQTAKIDAAFHPVMDLTVASGYVILLYVGSSDVLQQTMTIGSLYAFHRYIGKLIWPVTALGLGVTMIQQGRGSMDRINQVLTSVTDTPDSGEIDIQKASVLSVKHLDVYTPNDTSRCILTDVSFDVDAGEILGITGPIGAGKSILAQALVRLLPSSPNSIFLDSIPSAKLTLKSLRTNICYVPQESVIFSDTVRENLILGLARPVPDVELLEVLEIVDFLNDLNNLPNGLNTQLGERGVNLSGGQKQRLCLARALLRKSPFLLLDDGLSAVDTETEDRVLRKLSTWHKNQSHKTSLIMISHRLTTLKFATKLLILKDGRVEAIGHPNEVERLSPTYKQIRQVQHDSSHEPTLVAASTTGEST